MSFFQQIYIRLFLPISLIIIMGKPFREYKKHLLSTWHRFDKRSRIDSIFYEPVFYAWIKYEYLKEPDPDRRETLKELAMGGESGKNWARHYDSVPLDFSSIVGNLPFNESNPLFSETEAVLSKLKDAVIVQVGSSSGREIAYFASKFPNLHFIGTDIYPEVIEYSSQHHMGKNLTFQILSAKDIGILISKFGDRPVIVLSSGTLQNVQPEHLIRFFKDIARYAFELLLVEPGSDRQGAPDSLHGSRYRDNFSYTHDYRYYGEQAGLVTVKVKIIHPYLQREQFPHHYNTIHYFYHGSRKSSLES